MPTNAKKIRIGGVSHDIEDTQARSDISALKSAINDVTVGVKSVNRFNPNTITPMSVINDIGGTQRSSDTFTSDFIKCVPGQIFRLYRLTENNAFVTNSTVVWLAQYDENKNFLSRSSWKNNIAVDSNTNYIKFSCFNTWLTDIITAVTFDVTLTAETISAYNDNYKLANQDQVDNNTSEILELKDKVDEVFGESYLTTSDFSLGGYTAITNYSSPVPTENNIRIRCEKTVPTGNPLIIDRNNINFDFVYAMFDSTNNLIRGTGTWQTESVFINSENIKTVRISIRKSDNSSISVSDFDNCGIQIRTVNYFDSMVLPIKLKVMTYNIGNFSYGVSPHYLANDYAEKLANYKKFFAEQKCDIVGLQEMNKYLDGETSGNVTSNDAIFSYLYPYYSDTDNWTCIKSKYKLDGVGRGAFVASSRTYAFATINIYGKSIFLLCVHTTPNAGTEQDALRAQEVAEIISLVSDKDYFIVFGDFNAQTTALFDSFTTQGFHIANGGYLPFEWTYSYNSEDFSTDTPSTQIRYFDNIVTSSNITIDFSERLNVYAELSSDHIPFVAYLTIN